MSEMVKTGSKYTDEQRMNAAILYGCKGTFMAVERELGIPNQTVCGWAKADWWDDAVRKVREQNQQEHIAQYQELTRKALDKAHKGIDRLGDDLSASDIKSLSVAACAASDKALLLQGKATSISSKDASLADLKAQFEELSSRHKAIEESVVSEQ